ncbi:hypothetical protein GE21DRAFT_1032055 [Neurospora crassa]|nr:hypothetical protein GE21DRAFT_1032055 [Neurospora crassa]
MRPLPLRQLRELDFLPPHSCQLGCVTVTPLSLVCSSFLQPAFLFSSALIIRMARSVRDYYSRPFRRLKQAPHPRGFVK